MSDAPASPLLAWSAALADIVAVTAPSLVAVHSNRYRSSGFAWRPDLVVTADEALAEDGEVVVTAQDGKRAATVIGRDPSTDIALLRVEGAALQAVTFGSGPVRAGSLALAVGAGPLALSGIVAFAGPSWRSMRGGDIDARIELDLRLRREAEGGLAVDAGGHAFGMAVFGPRRRALVIPAATIDRVAARLERDGRIPRGYVGIGLQPVRIEDDGAVGAMIMSLDKSGPGASAGLHQGDVIVSWDGQPLSSVAALLRALGPDSPGQTVAIGLRRGGARLDLTLTIAERPRP